MSSTRTGCRHEIGRVIGRPAIDQPPVARAPRQDAPTRAPPSALPIAANSARQRSMLPKSRASASASRARLALVANAGEVDFVQDHRIGRDQFFTLQAVNDEDRCLRAIETGNLLGNRVQSFKRAAVVVFLMTVQQFLREALDLGRVEGQRLDGLSHRFRSCRGGRGSAQAPEGRRTRRQPLRRMHQGASCNVGRHSGSPFRLPRRREGGR